MKKIYFFFLLFIPLFSSAQNTWVGASDNYDNTVSGSDIIVSSSGMTYSFGVFFNSSNSTYTVTLQESNNNGLWWTSTFPDGLPNSLRACVVNAGGTWYIGTEYGIYYSVNEGRNWASASNGYNSAHLPSKIAVDDNGDLYVLATEFNTTLNKYISHVYKSTDNGANWVRIYNATGLPAYEGNGVLDVKGGILYIVLPTTGVYISTDAGLTWTSSTTGFNSSAYISDISVADNGDVYTISTAFNSSNSTYSPVIQLSTDNGASWSTVTTTGLSDVAANAISARGSTMYVSLRDGIYKSTDFTTTGILNNKPSTASVLYPNPATDHVNVPAEVNRIQILNTLGMPILVQTSGTVLDVSGLKNGMYIVQGYNDHNEIVFSERLTIQ